MRVKIKQTKWDLTMILITITALLRLQPVSSVPVSQEAISTDARSSLDQAILTLVDDTATVDKEVTDLHQLTEALEVGTEELLKQLSAEDFDEVYRNGPPPAETTYSGSFEDEEQLMEELEQLDAELSENYVELVEPRRTKTYEKQPQNQEATNEKVETDRSESQSPASPRDQDPGQVLNQGTSPQELAGAIAASDTNLNYSAGSDPVAQETNEPVENSESSWDTMLKNFRPKMREASHKVRTSLAPTFSHQSKTQKRSQQKSNQGLLVIKHSEDQEGIDDDPISDENNDILNADEKKVFRDLLGYISEAAAAPEQQPQSASDSGPAIEEAQEKGPELEQERDRQNFEDEMNFQILRADLETPIPDPEPEENFEEILYEEDQDAEFLHYKILHESMLHDSEAKNDIPRGRPNTGLDDFQGSSVTNGGPVSLTLNSGGKIDFEFQPQAREDQQYLFEGESQQGLITKLAKQLDDDITSTSNTLNRPDVGNTIRLSDCPIRGRRLLNGASYTVDGNYKMRLKLSASVPMYFDRLRAGKCRPGSPGLTIKDLGTTEVLLVIDLNECQLENDFPSEDRDHELSVESLNAPIRITFGLLDGEDGRPTSHYTLNPHASYRDTYHVSLQIGSGKGSEVAYDRQGRQTPPLEDNLHFNFGIFQKLGKEPLMQIKPTHGFSADKMSSIPEECFLHNGHTGSRQTLWYHPINAYGLDKSVLCQDKLKLDRSTNSWHFSLDKFMESAAVGDLSDLSLTCSMRVCTSNSDSRCSTLVETCGYDQYVVGQL